MRELKIGDAEVTAMAHIMRKVDFFAPLTVGDLDLILPHVMLFDCAAGETVFKQGDTGDAFYIVYSGRLDVWVKTGWFSRPKLVAGMQAGEFFGEMALISREKRSATVTCTEATRLFTLMAADFEFVLKGNPRAAAEMKGIAERRKFKSSHIGGS